MILEPGQYAEAFKKAGADILTVHIEACTHLHRNIQQIKALGMKAGVAVNPHTPVAGLADIIQDIDLVCLMSVVLVDSNSSHILYKKSNRLNP